MTEQNHFIRAAALSKSFGDTRANRDVDIAFASGRVHALLGENGAGKSTLIAILSGIIQPDSGELFVNGERFEPQSPADSLDARIATVMQRGSLVPELSVTENIRIHRQANPEFVDAALSIFERLHGGHVPPSTRIGSVDLGVRQLVEISRAIATRPKLLILDEPTALIDQNSSERLFAELHRLTRSGSAVLLVTHKLAEAVHLADDLTVLRQGQVVLARDLADLRAQGEHIATSLLVDAMFGGEAHPVESHPVEKQPLEPHLRSADEPRPVLSQSAETAAQSVSVPTFRLESVSTMRTANECPLETVTLEVHPGEILGIAGIAGNGQRHLATVISGELPVQSGKVFLGADEVSAIGVRQRMQRGLISITDDRFGEGLATGLSISLNLLLTRIGDHPFWRFSLTQTRAIRQFGKAQVATHEIRASNVDAPAGSLSGGNAQKLLLARGLSGSPKLIVLQQPTHGLDVNTVATVHETIRRAAQRGQAVIVISADLDEIVTLANRVLVLDSGRVVANVEGHQGGTKAEIASAMSGGAQ